MTTAFVILAAGLGTRVGRVGGHLHKALLPLGQQAVLSHLFDLAPPDARLIVCVGSRATQIRHYVELAHPNTHVTFVDVPDWNEPGAGPGHSLLAARDVVGDDDLVFTSCDTLWYANSNLWHTPESWAAYAPMPAGTVPSRWCRFDVQRGYITAILDKTSGRDDARDVYVGLARIIAYDLPQFWDGVFAGKLVDNELQVTGGLGALMHRSSGLGAYQVQWVDTGDESAYRRAVAQYSGYDWTKLDQATYVLPKEGRVVKYMRDAHSIETRRARGAMLSRSTPPHVASRVNMLAYTYVPGDTVYAELDPTRRSSVLNDAIVRRLLEWRADRLTEPVIADRNAILDIVRRFYGDKTQLRITQLRNYALRQQALDVVRRVDVDALAERFEPGVPHGDFNFGNVILTPEYEFVGIDWREDFDGQLWFDLRYDVAKLLAGTVVHWDNARRGDFTPWDDGERYRDIILEFIHMSTNNDGAHDVELIAALSLLNCAPLHAPPLDEVLVARGCAWLERLT